MAPLDSLAGQIAKERRDPAPKNPVTGAAAEKTHKPLSLVEVNRDKSEQALFYNIFLPTLDKEKAEAIVEMVLDKKKPLDEIEKARMDELDRFRRDAFDKFNKIHVEVEYVKDLIDEKLIADVAKHSKDMGDILKQVPAEQVLKFLHTRRIFQMAIAKPPREYKRLKRNLRAMSKRMNSETKKDLDQRVTALCKELGITEKQLEEVTKRDKGWIEVHWDLRKATLEKHKAALGKLKGWEKAKYWFKTMWKRESLLGAVANRIAIAKRCNAELKNIGNILAGTIDPEVRQQMYDISLDDDPEKKDFTWPPNMLVWRKDLDGAIKKYGKGKEPVERAWKAKVREYMKENGIEGVGKRKRKMPPGADQEESFREMQAKFIKDQWEELEKTMNREGPMNSIFKKRIDKLENEKKPTQAKFDEWVRGVTDI